MKKTALILFLLINCLLIFSLEYQVTFVTGYPIARGPGGAETDLEVGGIVRTGDTVITAEDETVNLTAGGFNINVKENSVFTVYEKKEEGREEQQDVLGVLLGQIFCTFDKLFGNEPDLTTNSAVCGVRGTRVALLAGADGSSLIIVEQGLVEVQAQGQSVTLGDGKGVEVQTGKAPGEVFDALTQEVDYRDWNAVKESAMLDDPLGTLKDIKARLNEYLGQIHIIYPQYLDSKAQLDRKREYIKSLKETETTEKVSEYYNQIVFPLELQTTYLYVNIRYYALSALSLRRYVLGRLYLKMKSKYIMDINNKDYAGFLLLYNGLLAKLQQELVDYKFIGQGDI